MISTHKLSYIENSLFSAYTFDAPAQAEPVSISGLNLYRKKVEGLGYLSVVAVA